MSLCVPALAEESGVNNGIPSDEFVKEYALHFMSVSEEGERNVAIDEFLRLSDGNGQLTGYYITFHQNGVAAGYVLISLISGEDPIVEFSFEGTGPLDLGSTSSTSPMSLQTTNSVDADGLSDLIYVGPGELYVPLANGEEVYSVYDHLVTELVEPPLTRSSVDLEAGILDWDEAQIDWTTDFKIADFGSGEDYWVTSDFEGMDHCAPTAGTNVLWYWGKMKNRWNVMGKLTGYSTDKAKAQAIFDTLTLYMGTIPGLIGTWRQNILSGYQAFFGVQPSDGGVWNYLNIANGASFNTYKTNLRDDCPIHLSLRTNTPGTSGGEGHSVMNIGYGYSTVGTPYLFVMDGWNNYGRFVKWNYYPDIIGIKIWVG